MNAHVGRYDVVRYPDGYAVIDKQNQHKIVFSTGNRAAAWRRLRELEKELER